MSRRVWITASEAAAILSEKAGRPIRDQYVRTYAKRGKIAWKARDGRTNEYLKSDVLRLEIKKNKSKEESNKEEPTPINTDFPIDEAA